MISGSTENSTINNTPKTRIFRKIRIGFNILIGECIYFLTYFVIKDKYKLALWLDKHFPLD